MAARRDHDEAAVREPRGGASVGAWLPERDAGRQQARRGSQDTRTAWEPGGGSSVAAAREPGGRSSVDAGLQEGEGWEREEARVLI